MEEPAIRQMLRVALRAGAVKVRKRRGTRCGMLQIVDVVRLLAVFTCGGERRPIAARSG
jgi:hypothetical protein